MLHQISIRDWIEMNQGMVLCASMTYPARQTQTNYRYNHARSIYKCMKKMAKPPKGNPGLPKKTPGLHINNLGFHYNAHN